MNMAPLTELPQFIRPEANALQNFRERIHLMETTDAPRFEGKEPADPISIYKELLADYDAVFPKYSEKRIKLSGIVSKIEDDEYGAPSFQFTDEKGTRCYALIVFPSRDIYQKVHEGDRAEIIGNVAVIREPYGLVVKKCELLEVSN